jgi:hypothetical protein
VEGEALEEPKEIELGLEEEGGGAAEAAEGGGGGWRWVGEDALVAEAEGVEGGGGG